VFLRHPLAEHSIFGFEELDLFLEFIGGRTGEEKQQGVEDHPGKMLLDLSENSDVATFLYTAAWRRRLQIVKLGKFPLL
jgi:hypothetical protein